MQHNSKGVCVPKRTQAYGYNMFCEKDVFSASIESYDNATFLYCLTSLFRSFFTVGFDYFIRNIENAFRSIFHQTLKSV